MRLRLSQVVNSTWCLVLALALADPVKHHCSSFQHVSTLANHRGSALMKNLCNGNPSCSSLETTRSAARGRVPEFVQVARLGSRLNAVGPAAVEALAATAGATAVGSVTGATAATTVTTAAAAGGTIVPSIVAAVASPFGAIGVLAFIVLFHELGHYLAARYFGITVEEFSIGFGPKLFGFTKFGNEFNLRALPLGGYVRFPENYDLEKATELERLADEAAQERRIREGRTKFTDYLVDGLTLGILDEQRRKAQKEKQRKEAMQGQGNLPWWKKLLKTPNGQRQQNGQRIENDPEDYQIEYYDDPNLLQNRPWTERFVVLSGGVFMNMVLAFSIYFGAIGFGAGVPQPIFESGVVVSAAPRADVPSSGLLYKNDVIVGVNGNQLGSGRMSPLAAQKEVGDVISAIRETPPGGSVQLTVFRGNGNNNKAPVDVVIRPTRTSPDAPATIGVLLSPNMLKTQLLKSDNALQATRLAGQQVYDVTSQTLAGFGEILAMMLSGKGAPPGQSLSGPIGLIKSGSDVVSTRDVTTVLLFAAAISINLGVVNALPLPALDGGQLVFVLAEAVTGRKIDQRLQEGITSVAILFLLLVTVRTAFGDVENILSR